MLFISMLRAMNASGAGRHGLAPMNNANLYGGGDGGVCVLAHACARIRWRACEMCLQYIIIQFDPG